MFYRFVDQELQEPGPYSSGLWYHQFMILVIHILFLIFWKFQICSHTWSIIFSNSVNVRLRHLDDYTSSVRKMLCIHCQGVGLILYRSQSLQCFNKIFLPYCFLFRRLIRMRFWISVFHSSLKIAP